MRKAILIIVLIAIGIAGVVIGIRASAKQDTVSNALTVPVTKTDVAITTSANGSLVDEFTYALAPDVAPALTARAGVATATTSTATSTAGVTYKTKKVYHRIGERVKAKAKILRTRDSLDDIVNVKAPFAGRIRELNTHVKATAGANAVILGTGRVLASVMVSEDDIDKIKLNQNVELTFDATNTVQTGKVVLIGVDADDSSGVKQYQVLIAPQALPKTAKLGMSVSATIVTEKVTGVLAVPTSAITMNGDQASVKILDANKLEQSVNVTVGLVGDSMTEITQGLTEGQQVVVGVDNAIPDLSNRPFRNQQSQAPPQNNSSGKSSN